tara:strand:- start:3405 stop:4412 length:1008 start_codon:yes stop_codon:yes gene_type:complete
MKIAIHHSPGSFSDRWIAYCKQKKISYKIVNCYDNNIIKQLDDCGALLWHHHHGNYRDVLAAKPILFSLEQASSNVFPDFNTAWHFDDKVAQKYLLEAINAPLVPSYVFYDKEEALNWAKATSYPKVFKLKGGAGAANVKLVANEKEARKLIHKAFGRGFSQFDNLAYFKDKFKKWKEGVINLNTFLRASARSVIGTDYAKIAPREKGYVYFQEFIPNNDSDYRIIVIGEKAIAIKRMVRKNDFRASGSGTFYYEKKLFENDLIKTAFKVADNLKTQCCAFDFVYQDRKPLIVEISYGFASSGYDKCPGYWTKDLKFHKGEVIPYHWMVEDVISN